MQGEDRLANLLDRLVELIDGTGYPIGDGIRDIVNARGALQHHPRCEESLDDKIVQVAGDAIAILVDGKALVLAPCLGEHEGDGRLRAERGREVHGVLRHEVMDVRPHQDEYAQGTILRAEGDEQSRAQAPVVRAGDHPGAVRIHDGAPLLHHVVGDRPLGDALVWPRAHAVEDGLRRCCPLVRRPRSALDRVGATVDDLHCQARLLAQCHEHDIGPCQSPRTIGDERKHLVCLTTTKH